MADSRLAEIYRKELKTKGLLGALVSASGARMKEKSDIRNILPQTGISGAAFEKMFGKKYRYGGNKDSVRSSGGDSGGGGGAEISKSMEEKITRLGVDMKIMAKNTVVLPAMARDMNLMRMNMQKMVKLSGGTPSNKSDMFFKRASDRETQYESQYKKNDISPTSANDVEKKNDGFGVLGFLGGLVKGLFGGILHGITSLLSTVLGPLLTNMVSLLIKGGLIIGIMTLIGKYFLEKEFRDSVNKIVVDLWNGITPEFKNQLLVGGAILLGAIVAWKGAMFLLGVAIDRLRLKLLGINFGPDGPGGRGGRGRGGRRGRPGAGNRMKNLGRFGLYGMGAYGLYEGYNSIFGGNEEGNEEENEEDYVPEPGQLGRGENETEAEYKKRFPQNYPEEVESSSNQSRLGLNTDTALAVGGTALGAGGLAYSASKIKKSLTPTSPTPASGTKPGFLMTAEDKIRERGAAQAKASSRWGRFLAFVAKKSPGLYARLGVKLAAMAGMATIPIAGWVSALFTLAFAISDIHAIYSLWSEFTNTDEETANPDVNEAKSKATNVTSATPVQQDVGFVDAEGVYHTGPAPSPTPAAAPKPAFSRVRRVAPGGLAKRGGNTSSTNVQNGNLLDIIAGGESGSMGYDAANRGRAGDMPGGYPGLSNMTVNDVMRLQSEGKVFATGRYQIIPKTLAGLMAGSYGNTGVSGNDLYNSSTQDKLATALINKRLEQGGGDPIKTQFALSQEFASIANPYTGSSFYDKVGNNKASIGTETIQAALTGTTGAILASSSPSTGTALNNAQSSLSAQILAMNGGGGQIINNNTTNAVMGGGSQDSGRSVNPYNADLMKYILSQVS